MGRPRGQRKGIIYMTQCVKKLLSHLLIIVIYLALGLWRQLNVISPIHLLSYCSDLVHGWHLWKKQHVSFRWMNNDTIVKGKLDFMNKHLCGIGVKTIQER